MSTPLPSPSLPGAPNRCFVNGDRARQGVRVRVPAYPGLRASDVVRLYWGRCRIEQTVARPVAEGGHIEVTVPEEAVLAAGDAAAVPVFYQALCAGREASAWSAPAAAIVAARDARSAPPFVLSDHAPNGIEESPVRLHTARLGSGPLTVAVLPVADEQGGDTYALHWHAWRPDGATRRFGATTTVTAARAGLHLFQLSSADAAQVGPGGCAALWSEHRRTGREPQASQVAVVLTQDTFPGDAFR